MRKTTFIFLLLSVFLITGCSNKTEQQKIDSFVADMNKHCPYTKDNFTLEKVESLGNKEIKISGTINVPMADENKEYFEKMLPVALKPIFMQIIKNDNRFKKITSYDPTFIFALSPKSKSFALDISISPDEYKNASDAPFEKNGKIDVENLLTTTTQAMKSQLPITDPETGVITKDVYSQGSLFVTVAQLPEGFTDDLDKEEFDEGVREYLRTEPSIQGLLKKGVTIQYKYLKSNGEEYSTIEYSLNK